MKRIVFTIIAVLVLPGAASANQMPWSTAVGGVRARPSVISLSVDGSGFVAGNGSGGSYNYVTDHQRSELTWTTWNATQGRAWGMEWIDYGIPCIACAPFKTYKATVHVWDPIEGVFTQMTINSRHRSYTFDALGQDENGKLDWYWQSEN
jgi:hypothetical protein